jgi:hypothetical protein
VAVPARPKVKRGRAQPVGGQTLPPRAWLKHNPGGQVGSGIAAGRTGGRATGGAPGGSSCA